MLSGKVLAGQKVKWACKRFLDDLKKTETEWPWKFDEGRANAVCGLIEMFPHEKGELAGQPVQLGDWQAFIFCNVFGWLSKKTGYRRFREALVLVPRGNGKALALDTPIPTPTGWKSQGCLEIGDEVFDERGAVCRVVYVHPVEENRPCFRVGFSDGSSIVADAQHEWFVNARRNGLSRNLRKIKRTWAEENIRTTGKIAATFVYAQRKDGTTEFNYRIPTCGPIECSEALFPIPPYVLGAWLGDGDSDCARITIGKEDVEEMSALLAGEGYPVRAGGHPMRYVFATGDRTKAGREASLNAALRRMGLRGNKHIPSQYLRGSFSQRLDLLRGLMDTDGSCAKNGQCEFTTISKSLGEGVEELLVSLGYKPTITVGRATIQGRDCGPKYRIGFFGTADRNPFRFERKAVRVKRSTKLSNGRQIVAVEPVDSVPVRCITVDSPSHLYLAGRSMVPTHNSPMGAWVANYMAWFDGEKGAEVYCAATTQEQAFHVFDPAKAIVESLGLAGRLGIVVPKGKFGTTMYQPATRSFLRVIIGKGKDGKAPHCVVNDEYHQQPDNELYDSLKRGMDKRKQSLMFNISTAGDFIEGPCYRMCERVTKLLEGLEGFENDRIFGIIYDVDVGVDWTTEHANIMANPNWGVSMDAEAMANSQAEAVRDSAQQNAYRCKNQNAWMQAAFGWMNMASWDACRAQVDEDEHRQTPCFVGSDMAAKRDICGTVKVFVWTSDSGKRRYSVTCKAYLPEKQVNDPARVHFQRWAHDGYLTVHEGGTVSYRSIEDDTVKDCEEFQVREVCFDPRYAGQYAEGVQARTGTEIVEILPSKYSEGMAALEEAVADQVLEHDGNPILRWCMANVVARRNLATGNYQIPGKDSPEKKIDLAIALIIAMVRAKDFDGSSGYTTADDLMFV